MSTSVTGTGSNPILLTAKLYETRNAMRFLWGDKYADHVKPLVQQLHEAADKWQLTPIKTMVKACDEMSKLGASGVDLAMVIAAYVEDVEGTFTE